MAVVKKTYHFSSAPLLDLPKSNPPSHARVVVVVVAMRVHSSAGFEPNTNK